MLSFVSSVFSSLLCLLCFNLLSIARHDIIFIHEPEHIGIQQNRAHCLGNAVSLELESKKNAVCNKRTWLTLKLT